MASTDSKHYALISAIVRKIGEKRTEQILGRSLRDIFRSPVEPTMQTAIQITYEQHVEGRDLVGEAWDEVVRREKWKLEQIEKRRRTRSES